MVQALIIKTNRKNEFWPELLLQNNMKRHLRIEKKSYRCPKFDGDAKQTLEIRVERKRNNRSKFSRENEGGYF